MEEIFIDDIDPKILDKEYLSKFLNGDIYEVAFLFKSDFNNAKYLRDYLFTILDILGIDSTWKNRFILIADELNNNAIEYGSKNGEINIFKFLSSRGENGINIKIEVEDRGNGAKAKKSSEMEDLRVQRLSRGFDNHHSIRGRGLFLIITKLVDKLYFLDSIKGGLIVGIEKTIKA